MDEFTDFQMAVGQSSDKNESSTGGTNGLWVLGQNPGLARTGKHFESAGFRNTKQPQVFPSSSLPVLLGQPPGSSKTLDKYGVGSRLANYNLGMKSGGVDTNETHTTKSNSKGFPQRNFQNQINSNCTTNNQSLLGEEDKYAALRALVSFETVPEIAQSLPSLQMTSINTTPETNSSSQQLPNVSKVVETEIKFNNINNLEDDFDFGDFQSFTHNSTLNDISQSLQCKGLEKSSCHVQTVQTVNLKCATTADEYQRVLATQKGEESPSEYGDFVSMKPQQSSINVLNTNWNNSPSLNAGDNNSIEALDPIKLTRKQSMDISYSYSNDKSSNSLKIQEFLNPIGSLNSSQISTLQLGSDNSSSKRQAEEMFDCVRTLPTSYIKTSLIGYDTGNSCVDSDNIYRSSVSACLTELNSVDFDYLPNQKELDGFLDKQKSFDVSPETRSIASLDLGNYYATAEQTDHSVKQFADSPSSLAQISNEESCSSEIRRSTSIPSTTNSDYFNEIMHDLMVENDSIEVIKSNYHLHTMKLNSNAIWEKCLTSSKELFKFAVTQFNEVSSSNVVREVVLNENGLEFIKGLVEVYRLCCRVRHAGEKQGCGNPVLETLHSKLQHLWETLITLLNGTQAMDLLTDGSINNFSANPCFNQCEICCNTLDTTTIINNEGVLYHSACANFWINTIDINLPSMSRTSLVDNPMKQNSPQDLRNYL